MRIYRKYFVVILLVILPVALHAQAALVNINIAGSSELQTLNGIGPAYAQRIIDYRNTNGPFEKIEDIKNVSGIGNVTFSNIKDYITVGGTGLTTETLANSTSTTANQTSANTNITTTAAASSQNSSNTVTISTHYSAAPLNNTETSKIREDQMS
ncbi:MAG: helix-hairpin-helix domain-containing protein [bacterium]|nr:helix-hairpin-helix domain-containing protein [bacterium]